MAFSRSFFGIFLLFFFKIKKSGGSYGASYLERIYTAAQMFPEVWPVCTNIAQQRRLCSAMLRAIFRCGFLFVCLFVLFVCLLLFL